MNFSKEKVNEDFIGKIYFDENNKSINVEDLLKNGEKCIYDLDIQPVDLSIIDDRIILANYYGKCLTVYDKDLNLLKRIDKINGKGFQPIAIQVNLKEKFIYICDFENFKILMTDFHFNLIKSIGSQGALRDICYKKEDLLICDYGNIRIQIYSKDLEFIKSIKLDYQPWRLKATNSIICVMADTLRKIHF